MTRTDGPDTVRFEERSWVSSDGLTLFARDYSARAGPARLPVICLHGLTRNSKDFDEVAPAITAMGRRVLVPDIRGRGQSERDPAPHNYQPKTYARDILAMMDRLGIARAVFLGTSMGGIITMAVAALRSRAISAAILNDVGPAVDPAGIARIMTYVGGKTDISNWAEAAAYVRWTSETAFPNYGKADWDRLARRTFRDTDGVPRLDYDPAIMIPLLEGRYKAPTLLAWLLFRRLSRRRPTLLIRGALSDILSSDIAQRMRRHAPTLEYLEIAGIGHAPMLTEPDAARALESFLSRID